MAREDQTKEPKETKEPKQPIRPFEDVHSDSAGVPRRPDFIQNRLNEEWGLPEWERSRRRTSPEEEELPPRDRDLPREPLRRPDKPRKGRKRLTVGIILIMGIITAAAVLFLGFKIKQIDVTGSLPEGVSVQQVVDASGIQLGENLVFLSDRTAREEIPRVLPWIQAVAVHKRLPDRVELEVNPASAGAVLAVGDQWLALSQEGKILSLSGEPGDADLLRVLAPLPTETTPGRTLAFEDKTLGEALLTILRVLPAAREESGLPGVFTLLDLRDSSAISLYYQDKVQLLLGSVVELEYKLQAGCRFLAEPTAGENGVLDLTSTPETKRGVMTAGTIVIPQLPGQNPAAEPTPVPTPDPDATPNPRDKDIPSTVFTGEPTPAPAQPSQEESSQEESAQEESSQEETGSEEWSEPEGEEESSWEEEQSTEWSPENEDETGNETDTQESSEE